ncbi:MAG: hypothetical protein NTAFB05_11670 [Nitrobacter sp.]|uniref:hypothetical protein n=1 Tax=Nitrobacter sp. TaxID=29420 RepID=UPI00387DD7E5
MGVETGINGRLANRHATEARERAIHCLRHAAGSTGRQVRRPFGLAGIAAVVGTLDVNLTDTGPAERKTNWQRRATNHTFVVLSKYAQRIGPSAHSDVAYEKLRHVDV